MSRKNKKEKRSKKKSAEVFEELDNEVTEEYEETSEDASDYADNNVEADESGSYDNSEAYTTGADDADLDDEADMTDNNDTNNEASETSSNNNNSDEVSEEPDEPEEEEEPEEKEKDLFKKHIEREAILDQIFEDFIAAFSEISIKKLEKSFDWWYFTETIIQNALFLKERTQSQEKAHDMEADGEFTGYAQAEADIRDSGDDYVSELLNEENNSGRITDESFM